MTRLAAFAFVVSIAVAPHALAQVPASPAPAAQAPKAKPTSDEKRCIASRRRVERQQAVIAEADARVERDKASREGCKTKRACDSLDRALKASSTRQQRYGKQLAQFESEASKACAAVKETQGVSEGAPQSPATPPR